MAASFKLSKSGLWLLLGVLGATGAQSLACSSSERSFCSEAGSCAPEPHASAGAAGDDSAGTAGDDSQPSAGAGGAGKDEPGGAASGGGGGLAGGVSADGGSDGGEAGSAGDAGASGNGPTLGDCRTIVATGPKVPPIMAGAVAPTLTNGEIHAGHYHQTKFTYYDPGNTSTDDSPVSMEVEVSGSTAVVYLTGLALLIEMGTTPGAPPQSVKLSCYEFQPELVGVELKDQIHYQADSTTLQLLFPIQNTGWDLQEFTIDP